MEEKNKQKPLAHGLTRLTAQAAGVSAETVRKVLQNLAGVSAQTRERVLVAATQVKRQKARKDSKKQGKVQKLLNSLTT